MNIGTGPMMTEGQWHQEMDANVGNRAAKRGSYNPGRRGGSVLANPHAALEILQ